LAANLAKLVDVSLLFAPDQLRFYVEHAEDQLAPVANAFAILTAIPSASVAFPVYLIFLDERSAHST
jgi:hypothetical protein